MQTASEMVERQWLEEKERLDSLSEETRKAIVNFAHRYYGMVRRKFERLADVEVKSKIKGAVRQGFFVGTSVGRSLLLFAEISEGKVEWDDYFADEVMANVQMLLEDVFANSMDYKGNYEIPAEFWDSDFGKILSSVLDWVRQEN